MKKRTKFQSLLYKSTLTLLLSSILFLFIAMPIAEKVMFNSFHSFLVEYTTLHVNSGSTKMANYLSLSNNYFRRNYYSEEFQQGALAYVNDEIDENEFMDMVPSIISEQETSFFIGGEKPYSSKGYPTLYIEGKPFISHPKVEAIAKELFSSEWFQNHISKYTRNSAYTTITVKEKGRKQTYFCFVVTRSTETQPEIPYCAVLFTPFSDIELLWENMLNIGATDYAFLGLDNEILYQNKDSSILDFDYIRDNMIDANQHSVISHEENNKKGMFYSVLVSFEQESLRYVSFVDNTIFDHLFLKFAIIIKCIMGVMIFLFTLLFITILGHVLKRLKDLSDKMSKVQKGDYNVSLTDTTNDEIGQLNKSFNIMTEEIRKNIDETAQREKLAKTLQYNLMISAIDPHFIYNTLNTSNRLAEFGRIKEVIDVNDALIKFMRDNLKMKNLKAYDTVANEIDVLNEYVLIQNYLCDNTITMYYHISEEEKKLMIPKFLLQPFVENAILHGIVLNLDEDGNAIPGIIDISAHVKNKRILLSVKDNGIGMSKEVIDRYFTYRTPFDPETETQPDHIGLQIIYSRLSYLYDQDYDIYVTSQPGFGTEIIVEIPFTGYQTNI